MRPALGYTGAPNDSNGLLYLNARYLDPASGTFLTRDPFEGMAESAMSRNPYSYTGGDPVNLLSPNGQTLTADGLRTKVTIIGHRDSDDTNRRLLIGLAALGVGVVVGAATFGALGPAAGFFVAALGEGSAPFVGAAALGISGALSGQAVRATNNIGLGRPILEGLGKPGDIALDAAFAIGGAAVFGELTGTDPFTDVIPRSATSGMCSFSADTEVATDHGEEPISDLKVGDQVLAYDQSTGTTGDHTVRAVLKHIDKVLVHLTLDGEHIETTPEHPFFTRERGWVAAGDLKVGEHIRKADGSYGSVEKVEREQRQQVMYNLTVDKVHTFFVGNGQWLVHNKCPQPSEVWSLTADGRAEIYEPQFGANLDIGEDGITRGGDNLGGFKTYDKWDAETKTATSMKSIDLNSPTYIKRPGDITRTLRKYIDKIASFDSDLLPDRVTRLYNTDIETREMLVLVPPGSGNIYERQMKILARFVDYAALQTERNPIPVGVSIATYGWEK
ncbi:MAG: polymorphic toxin-type HINT domain-containing protein [Chloroflexota bacterium]